MHIRMVFFYAKGYLNNGLCYLKEHPTLMQVQSNKCKLDNQNDAYLWHPALGHISKNWLSLV